MELGLCCMGSLLSISVPDDRFMTCCNNSFLACDFVSEVLFLAFFFLNTLKYIRVWICLTAAGAKCFLF